MADTSHALELLQLLLDNRIYFYRTVYAVLVILAFWKGGAPERAIAGLFTATFIVNRIYYDVLGQSFELGGVDQFSLLVDSIFCTAMVVIGVQANRIYPLWMAGLQIIAVQAHLARAIAPDIALLAYAIMVIGPSYGQLLVFGLGIRAHRKRLAIYGKYRSWRGSWPRLPGMKQTS